MRPSIGLLRLNSGVGRRHAVGRYARLGDRTVDDRDHADDDRCGHPAQNCNANPRRRTTPTAWRVEFDDRCLVSRRSSVGGELSCSELLRR
jgi:hypothetical protein